MTALDQLRQQIGRMQSDIAMQRTLIRDAEADIAVNLGKIEGMEFCVSVLEDAERRQALRDDIRDAATELLAEDAGAVAGPGVTQSTPPAPSLPKKKKRAKPGMITDIVIAAVGYFVNGADTHMLGPVCDRVGRGKGLPRVERGSMTKALSRCVEEGTLVVNNHIYSLPHAKAAPVYITDGIIKAGGELVMGRPGHEEPIPESGTLTSADFPQITASRAETLAHLYGEPAAEQKPAGPVDLFVDGRATHTH